MNCPDCNAKPGEKHGNSCDFETCPVCGGQLLSCGHYPNREERLVWTGEHEMHKAAEEFGFYCYEDPNGYGKPEMHYGHIPCEKDHPGAHPDLNRVYRECQWDPKAKKYMLKGATDGTGD